METDVPSHIIEEFVTGLRQAGLTAEKIEAWTSLYVRMIEYVLEPVGVKTYYENIGEIRVKS